MWGRGFVPAGAGIRSCGGEGAAFDAGVMFDAGAGGYVRRGGGRLCSTRGRGFVPAGFGDGEPGFVPAGIGGGEPGFVPAGFGDGEPGFVPPAERSVDSSGED